MMSRADRSATSVPVPFAGTSGRSVGVAAAPLVGGVDEVELKRAADTPGMAQAERSDGEAFRDR